MARSKSFPDSVDPGMPVLPACPSGWAQRKFGDVLRAIERPIALDEEMTYTLVNAKRSRGGIVLRDRKPGKEVKVPTQFIVREGDFVISRRQIIHGACGIVPRDLDGAIVSNEYLVLNSTDELSTKYLSYFSHTPYFQRTCFHSSVGVDVEKMVFKEDQWFQFPFPLPPLNEQKKIAAILSSVDEVIAKTEAVIAQLQIVKKAMMEQLLTKGMPGRHTRFKQTEIGEIPEEWEVVPLGDLLDGIDAGWSPQCETRMAEPHEWGVLKVSAVSSGKYLETENKALPKELPPRPAAEVLPGDILLARANGVLELVGRTVFVHESRERLMLSDKIMRLRPSARIAGLFMHYSMNASTARDQILELTGGSHMRNISQDALRRVVLPVPSRSEQAEISSQLAAIELVTRCEDRTLSSVRSVKESLSSSLLSGEIRVISEVA